VLIAAPLTAWFENVNLKKGVSTSFFFGLRRRKRTLKRPFVFIHQRPRRQRRGYFFSNTLLGHNRCFVYLARIIYICYIPSTVQQVAHCLLDYFLTTQT
jgi:hypothetical protein